MAVSPDAATPNIARMYDYWLGGKDNFAVDRQAADAVRDAHPQVAEQALDNKRFLTRAVREVAGHGIRQFIDVGSGLPTSPGTSISGQDGPAWLATHEAAGAEVSRPVVAYVDYDPVAVRHSRALLAQGRDGVVAVQADMRDPAAILHDERVRGAGFDLGAPACVILACVLHFVPGDEARDIVARFARELAAGSYLIVSVGFARADSGAGFVRTYNAQQGPRIYGHSWATITGFFDGLTLLPPGLTDTACWPEPEPGERPSFIAGAVARKIDP
jgi:O-methyltransferase involved in polyketide biosynthesis